MPKDEFPTHRSGWSMGKRVDVQKGKMITFIPGQTYFTRFGFFDSGTAGRAVFVLEPQHHCPTKILQPMDLWESYYLSADISALSLASEDLKHLQMVVSVDSSRNPRLPQREVRRGFFMGSQRAMGNCLLYCLDTGSLEEFPLTSLYATTELVVGTLFKGFPCVLDNLELFRGSKCLQSAMAALELEEGTLCKVICKGFAKGERNLPVVDFWPYTVETGEPLPDSIPANMTVATTIINEWITDFKRPPSSFSGTVVNITKDAKVNIQIPGRRGEESHAVCMDNYLDTFEIDEIQRRIPCLQKAAAVTGRLAKTVYLSEFSGDKLLYRCRVLEVLNEMEGVNVEFIDFGNTEIVPYEKVFEAAAVDKVLGMIPPLVWEAYLFTINKVVDVENAMDMFANERDLEFKICAGKRNGLPLVSITGKDNDGIPYNMFQKLHAAGLIIPTS